jgi:RNA polymerase sigma-70 factor (ECF subfamily)
VIRKEELKEARMALAQIHPSYQDIIVWHYIDELSITEISEILDKNEGTVRVLIHRAVKSLKRVMENGNNEENDEEYKV